VTPASSAALRDAVDGPVFLPGDDAYDEVRLPWQRKFDPRPVLVAEPTGTEGVRSVVGAAREHDLPFGVQGTGHGSVRPADGGVLLRTSRMSDIEVDPSRAVARVAGGAVWRDVIEAAAPHGLGTLSGTSADVSVAGYTLGGGAGWLSRLHGFAADSVLRAELVTAGGEVVTASEDENPDLFWALRGGSGNFGVVTRFEMKLHPLAQVTGGMILHPFEHAADVLRFYRDYVATAPDELTVYAAILTLPGGPKAVALICCWSGTEVEGEHVLAPIRAFGAPFADTIQPMPYSTMNTLIDEGVPPGLRYYWKESMLRELADGTIDTIVDYANRIISPRTALLIDDVHGAAHRVEPTATAFPHRDAPHALVMLSGWEDPADDEVNVAWTRELNVAIRPWATGGVYVNEAWDVSPTAAFGVNYERLVEIKTRYDPANLFRHTANIAPVSAPGDS